MSTNHFYKHFLAVTNRSLFVDSNVNSSISDDYCKIVLENLPCLAGVFNHTSNAYEYMNKGFQTILGYNPVDFVGKESMVNVIDIIHPDHLPVFAEHIWVKIMEYLFKKSEGDTRQQYRFNNSFLIRKKDGTYIWIMHQFTTVEFNADGIPLRSVFTMHEIGGIKKDNNIDLFVSILGDDQVYKHLEYYSFESNTAFTRLTAREIEILGLLNKGLSTKEIGEKLFISVHTVSNHRKKMLSKIDAKNTNELIYYYKQRGVL